VDSKDFAWEACPQGLLRQLKRDLEIEGPDLAGALKRRFGSPPSESFVKSCWPTIRDKWVIKTPAVRTSVVSDLRTKGLGRADVKVTTARGEVAYLRSCRNSPALRSIVLRHLVAANGADETVKSPVATRSAATRRAQSTTGDAWSAFAGVLALTLAQMEVDQYLVLNPRSRKNLYVQFALQGPSGVRMETVSNNFLPEWERLEERDLVLMGELGWNPPTRGKGKGKDIGGSPNFYRDWPLPVHFEEISELTVRTLRDVLDVRHPGLLSYRAFTKGDGEIILPNLGIVREARPPRNVDSATTPAPANPEDLLAQVQEVMKKVIGADTIVVDADGDIPVQCERVVTYVRVQKDAPVVTVFAPVIWDMGTHPTSCKSSMASTSR
jgi:hypothetical protein